MKAERDSLEALRHESIGPAGRRDSLQPWPCTESTFTPASLCLVFAGQQSYRPELRSTLSGNTGRLVHLSLNLRDHIPEAVSTLCRTPVSLSVFSLAGKSPRGPVGRTLGAQQTG